MDDNQIIELYVERNEQAIEETSSKYGGFCFRIAYNILANREDSDESVNDTYLRVWECIPPHKPAVFSAFIGKITRRVSLNKWRDRNRIKRGGGQIFLALNELEECIPAESNIEEIVECKELALSINVFLGTLSEIERDVFVCRYWALASVQEISSKFHFSESKTKTMLFRTREKLKVHLQKGGFM